MSPTAERKFVIIGAGPTGLGASLRLLELGETDFTVLEAADHAGGLASSVVDPRGFTWDLGGHVQFSHYEKFDQYMNLALRPEDWNTLERESWVWIHGRFVPYPFQYNLHRLPRAAMWSCVKGLLDASRAEHRAPANFHDWIIATFGKGIADEFLLPYNFKVWAHPPAMLSAQWVGERVAVPDLELVIRGVCLGEDNVSWGPNSTFRFPKHGGTGAIWRNLAERIPLSNKLFCERVTSIDRSAHLATTASGRSFRYEHLVSTMPLTTLANMIGAPDIALAADNLLYSSVHVVGIGLRGQPPEHLRTKCWMYFPEDNCPFYRVTVFSNYGADNVPEPGTTWSLMTEVSQSEHKSVNSDTVVADVIQGLRVTKLIDSSDAVVSRWYRRLSHGYPTPSLTRDEVLANVLPALESWGIYSRGRFGAWRYEVSNQDHSFMQGVEVIDHIRDGHVEFTHRRPELVNGRRNVYPYAEWAAMSQ